jgi:polygalacturonase
VRRPWFAARYFPVTDFGAKGDGTTLNTQAFAKAIAACHRAGGGHVVVPAGGAVLTGAIHLRSNVDLHVERNATILFSQNPADYLPVVFTRWQGIELMNYGHYLPPQMIQPFASDTVLLEG